MEFQGCPYIVEDHYQWPSAGARVKVHSQGRGSGTRGQGPGARGQEPELELVLARMGIQQGLQKQYYVKVKI